MSIRSILAAFLFAAPVMSQASDALIYVFVYECNAVEINQDLVEMCSSQFPDLSPKADDALLTWRDRNLPNAHAAMKKCARELDEKSKSATADELQAIHTLIADTKAKIHSSFQDQIRKEGPAACLDVFDQLKKPGGLMNIR